jgi:metallo-beta-lactamase class B
VIYKLLFEQMNKIIIGLIAVMAQLTGFSQSGKDVIKISDDIELIKISDNAYVHVSYANLPDYGRIGENGLILIDKKQAFLFDSPWTDAQTEKLFSWLKDSMDVKITGFIPNHWHVDCMGGLKFIQEQNIESYANQMTIEIAKTKGLPVPKHGFKDSLQLHLGDKLICCYYLGAAHSLDNIAVWIPSGQILFAGCMVKSIDSKNLGNTADGDVIAYPQTINRLMTKFPMAKIVIPGHGKFGGTDLIEHTKELLVKKP